MKNYHEFKGYSFRLDFDPESKNFVATKLEPTMLQASPPASEGKPKAEESVTEEGMVVKLRKKPSPSQASGSPKAMRSRTCISFRKILPR